MFCRLRHSSSCSEGSPSLSMQLSGDCSATDKLQHAVATSDRCSSQLSLASEACFHCVTCWSHSGPTKAKRRGHNKQEAPQARQDRAAFKPSGKRRWPYKLLQPDPPISVASQLSRLLPAHSLTSLTHLSIAELPKARSAALA